MNVQEKIREFRKRVEREAAQQLGRDGSVEQVLEELEVFRGSCLRLSSLSEAVGRMPPSPNTRRARLGSFLIRIMQRALFWYTPPIIRFQNEVAHALSTGCSLFEMQRQQIGAQDHEIRVLRGELLRLRGESRQPVPDSGANGNGKPGNGCGPELAGGARNELLESFLFASYDQLRGEEGETAQKLDAYLATLRNLTIPEGQWLDLGCGRGEWIAAAGAAGYSVTGVDSNPSAAGYCHEMGLNVVEQDALQYLRKVTSGTLAVITAFHVIEHFRPAELLVLVQEAVRALKPGGLLIIETPDPANLTTASHHFWRDPSHQRPVPMSLLELIYDYFGLTIVERLHLNRPPGTERLPFNELEVVRRLNEHLYGPQDYGLIGRR